jgi:hypothetical protein
LFFSAPDNHPMLSKREGALIFEMKIRSHALWNDGARKPVHADGEL